MRLLALDAATEHCSVALWMDGRVLERAVEAGKAHAEDLLDMVREVLAEGRVDLAELDGIAASIGPGAFTGVRVSVAVAQGLAFGAGLRVVAVSTLEALALRAHTGGASALAVGCAPEGTHQVILHGRSGKNVGTKNEDATATQRRGALLYNQIAFFLVQRVGQSVGQ